MPGTGDKIVRICGNISAGQCDFEVIALNISGNRWHDCEIRAILRAIIRKKHERGDYRTPPASRTRNTDEFDIHIVSHFPNGYKRMSLEIPFPRLTNYSEYAMVLQTLAKNEFRLIDNIEHYICCILRSVDVNTRFIL